MKEPLQTEKLHFSKKSVLCQEFLDKYGHWWHKEIVAKQLLIRETHRRTLMPALTTKRQRANYEAIYLTKEAVFLEIPAKRSPSQGPRTT